jgi:hypothetical protein
VSTTATALRISLELDCEGSELCASLARPLLEQLDSGDYELCSVLELPVSIGAWLAEHRTARKRATRSGRRGYIVGELRREERADEIYLVNTSARHRQGRPMGAGYRIRETYSPLPEYPCARHAIRTTGIEDRGYLVGYLTMIRCGELALVSQILGHAEHLQHEIMYQLFAGALAREIDADPFGVCVYNRHDSGTDGLRFFKERLGFEEAAVEWAQ